MKKKNVDNHPFIISYLKRLEWLKRTKELKLIREGEVITCVTMDIINPLCPLFYISTKFQGPTFLPCLHGSHTKFCFCMSHQQQSSVALRWLVWVIAHLTKPIFLPVVCMHTQNFHNHYKDLCQFFEHWSIFGRCGWHLK